MSAAAHVVVATGGAARADDAAASFESTVRPILQEHCFDCHADGEKKGSVAFDDAATTAELVGRTELWASVLKNVRSGLMPPAKKGHLSPQEKEKVAAWIKSGAFKLDPAHPDPGRVTLRRLNRVEYRNTVRALTGFDFRTDEEFPADDTGYGFDTIADVLSTSPLLLEKYLQAAESIVAAAVPTVGKVMPERVIPAGRFTGPGGDGRRDGDLTLSFYDPTDIVRTVRIEKPGTYRLAADATVRGSFDFDPGRVIATFFVDGQERWKRELKWKDGQRLDLGSEEKWEPGEHALRIVVQPLVSRDQKPKDRGEGATFANVRFESMTVAGPLEKEHWTVPPNYRRFFTRDEPPADPAERRAYAAETIARFADRAFRRPTDPRLLEKLTQLAMNEMAAPEATFERGIARAFTAVLASPRFLFRQETVLRDGPDGEAPLLDEYSLASRLSYFLWSTMPDAELLDLAARGELRKNLAAQVKRMVGDERSEALVQNFAGQWLQTRDVESVSIDARVVQARDAGSEGDFRARFEQRRRLNEEVDKALLAGDTERVEKLRAELNGMRAKFGAKRIEFSRELRTAMRREAELFFSHMMREDRSVLELIGSDYTFLNGALANHYGIPGVEGDRMRLVPLPADSVRGGVLTMGSTLAVTSNPTRTSPVKRGLFVLENFLGTPPPPPPANVPSLEVSAKAGADGRELSLREALAIHREKPLCASCHDRMDPLGLAFENFNAMGLWREKERGQPIPSAPGQLITGEGFADVRELKRVIATDRREDFYRCLTEKLLTYAIGRGPEPCDVPAVDGIVERLQRDGGRFSAVLSGVIESTPFQRRRADADKPKVSSN